MCPLQRRHVQCFNTEQTLVCGHCISTLYTPLWVCQDKFVSSEDNGERSWRNLPLLLHQHQPCVDVLARHMALKDACFIIASALALCANMKIKIRNSALFCSALISLESSQQRSSQQIRFDKNIYTNGTEGRSSYTLSIIWGLGCRQHKTTLICFIYKASSGSCLSFRMCTVVRLMHSWQCLV